MRARPPGLPALLRHLPLAPAARQRLHHRLAAPGRHYHGPAHVALLWRRHAALPAPAVLRTAQWRTRMACAIAFHDAVHEPGRGDNEAASAALWRRAAAHLARRERRWVEQAILATADHLRAPVPDGPGGLALARLLDLDLSPLGERPAVFDANTGRLRAEAVHLPAAAWEAALAAFLARMAAAPRLFRTRALRARFEARARANLRRASRP